MFYASDIVRWFQRKRYQYEVTFSLYMMTPTEKFIFNSFIFLFLSMILIAGCLYLPEHIATMWSRAWFYYAGPDETATTAGMVGKTTLGEAGAGIGEGSMTGAAGMQGKRVFDHLEDM